MISYIEKLRAVAMLAIAVTILTGCGGGGTTAVTTTADTTAPTTTVAPAVSVITATATTLSVTVNENGTGYYLVRTAAAAAPTVADVQAGTAFALTANVPATPAISGLALNTAYSIYFVAKDAANNAQATVQSVAVTTLLTTGYVVQGGLTWMPVTFLDTWTNADAYCNNTNINGQTGWRMPTKSELSALYTSGAMNGQGWTLGFTWSSELAGLGNHSYVGLGGGFGWALDTVSKYVSCVRSDISATANTTSKNLTVGSAMSSFTPLTASGGTTPYTYSYTGTLPAGLSFSSSTGAVTGIPTATYATANLVFTVKDANNVVASTSSTVSFTVVAASVLPAGYVVQGGLTWMPVTIYSYTWPNADAYCTNTTINGQTGWRMPTEPELSTLYASGAMNGQGWALSATWSSTYSMGGHNLVDLSSGNVAAFGDPSTLLVSCVR